MVHAQNVLVAVSPSSRPLVRGLAPLGHYKPGDVVNLTCSSPDSFPAANISWFINGNKVAIIIRCWATFSAVMIDGIINVP